MEENLKAMIELLKIGTSSAAIKATLIRISHIYSLNLELQSTLGKRLLPSSQSSIETLDFSMAPLHTPLPRAQIYRSNKINRLRQFSTTPYSSSFSSSSQVHGHLEPMNSWPVPFVSSLFTNLSANTFLEGIPQEAYYMRDEPHALQILRCHLVKGVDSSIAQMTHNRR